MSSRRGDPSIRRWWPLGAAALIVACTPDDPASRTEREPAAQGRAIAPPADDGRAVASGPDVVTRTPPTDDDAETLVAHAEIQPLGDAPVHGTADFRRSASGMTIEVMISGLSPGDHGFHIHENAECTAPGEHLNPDNSPHGGPDGVRGERHHGDLGNVTADDTGTVAAALFDPQIGSDDSFLGRALVIHAVRDDLASQPSGASGDPVACGRIERVE